MGNNNIEDIWEMTSEQRRKHFRRLTHKKYNKPLPDSCPECGAELILYDDETICIFCGLVCSSPHEYVAGIHIDLPYGRH